MSSTFDGYRYRLKRCSACWCYVWGFDSICPRPKMITTVKASPNAVCGGRLLSPGKAKQDAADAAFALGGWAAVYALVTDFDAEDGL